MTAVDVPPRVRRAEQAAADLEFGRDGRAGPSSCTEATGRLLAVLAAGRPSGRLGEIGTGVGYGTAWMASAMGTDATLVTIEIDEERAAAATDLFADDDRVTVVRGDANLVVAEFAPYDLLFVDGAGAGTDPDRFGELVGLLRIGGTIVVDDVTPLAALPPDSPFRTFDAKRAAFAGTVGLRWTEVVAPGLDDSVLVGTRTA